MSTPESTPIKTLCRVCGEVATGGYLRDGAWMHPHCYWRENPLQPSTEFYLALRNAADPVLFAETANEVVPAYLQQKILGEYNRRLMLRWLRMCQP